MSMDERSFFSKYILYKMHIVGAVHVSWMYLKVYRLCVIFILDEMHLLVSANCWKSECTWCASLKSILPWFCTIWQFRCLTKDSLRFGSALDLLHRRWPFLTMSTLPIVTNFLWIEVAVAWLVPDKVKLTNCDKFPFDWGSGCMACPGTNDVQPQHSGEMLAHTFSLWTSTYLCNIFYLC